MNAPVKRPKLKKRAVIDAAVELILAAHTHGDRITNEELESAFGLERPTGGSFEAIEGYQLKFFTLKYELKKLLLKKHKMALDTDNHGGFDIIRPEDQTAHGAKVASDGIERAIAQGRSIVRNTRLDGMSDAQVRENRDELARLAAVKAFATSSRKRPSTAASSLVKPAPSPNKSEDPSGSPSE